MLDYIARKVQLRSLSAPKTKSNATKTGRSVPKKSLAITDRDP